MGGAPLARIGEHSGARGRFGAAAQARADDECRAATHRAHSLDRSLHRAEGAGPEHPYIGPRAAVAGCACGRLRAGAGASRSECAQELLASRAHASKQEILHVYENKDELSRMRQEGLEQAQKYCHKNIGDLMKGLLDA